MGADAVSEPVCALSDRRVRARRRAASEDTFYLDGNPFGQGLDLDRTRIEILRLVSMLLPHGYIRRIA